MNLNDDIEKGITGVTTVQSEVSTVQLEGQAQIKHVECKSVILAKFATLSIVKKFIAIAFVVIVVVLVSISIHHTQVKRSWGTFLRSEMGLYQATDSEIADLAKFCENHRKRLSLSRDEYKSIMRAGSRSGYFDY